MNKKNIIGVIGFILVLWGLYRWLIYSMDSKEVLVAENQTIVGMITRGTVDDGGWTQSHYNGLEAIRKELNLKILYYENIEESQQCFNKIEDLIKKGAKIVIATSNGYSRFIKKAAEKHPDVKFFQYGKGIKGKNILTFEGRTYQMRYLAGIMAGLQTKTNKIGYVAAVSCPETICEINAFTLGVTGVNPKASVYVEWTNSWDNDEAAYRVSQDVLNRYTIDILTYHHNSYETLQAAEERDIGSIGFYLDQRDLFPGTVLTSNVFHWDIFYKEQIVNCLKKRFRGKHFCYGLERGIVGLADFSPKIKPEISMEVEERKALLAEGSWDVFYGPIYDQDGDIKVEDGDKLNDEEIFEEFNWFVKGVIGGLP